MDEQDAAPEKTGLSNAVYLFTSATCPNCKIAKRILDKQGIQYELKLANENVQLAEELGVRQAPTLVVIRNGSAEKHAGVSDIKKYLSV